MQSLFIMIKSIFEEIRNMSSIVVSEELAHFMLIFSEYFNWNRDNI